MATISMMFIFGLLFFVVTPWIGNLNHKKMHNTDLMAGDE